MEILDVAREQVLERGIGLTEEQALECLRLTARADLTDADLDRVAGVLRAALA